MKDKERCANKKYKMKENKKFPYKHKRLVNWGTNKGIIIEEKVKRDKTKSQFKKEIK